MAFFRGITHLPYEVYPIIFMMSCGVGFGVYVTTKKLINDGDMRIRSNYGIRDWTERLETLQQTAITSKNTKPSR
ncbi:hypothetical protein BASA50_010823 [Batrachochytrium salamandrivorans]|uniref:NADH dehydrogenase [ubiquinone] 1 alpha subcomplex subunit 1 n=1 Tax=Batrachochytrium salamandrivorans TaxID=1357716 RepID=A0ABQ8EXB9_9FUNG|nr:hypothetical protein BASA62_004298 [Batrachochytrium salamandrivorans]KAH6588272.1 hypothetical protein BASA50_010823 [Batrachochytrium salamandrivorans]KAH6597165.1 hypothetical protein BASA61_003228 [Batrachochytrium salamandrivorans]KAJ1343689.1 hypothetical protein BSLG_001764 [Batrachochytrium salamandrivorans]